MKCLRLMIWLLVGCIGCAAWAQPISNDSDRGTTRPTVAVVLSGGGAKGSAHIGALRVIEKAGIPIDYVVGTSMGALIGGLYATGYTTAQLDSLLSSQDWKVLLSDRESPNDQPLAERLRNERYALSIPFKAGNPEFTNGGFVKGANLGHLFYQLLYPYNEHIDFNNLPIPFACVAVDVASGDVKEFHEGILQDAMRASMSIPGLFTPVRQGDEVLVDGGIMNNYPMDVAKKMGADIIIGVDVQAALLPAEQLKGLDKVLLQVIDVATNNDYFAKIDSTDIYIKVDVSGYSAASFTTEAIDTLKRRGELAALSKWNDLKELRHRLDLAGREQPLERQARHVATAEEVRAATHNQQEHTSLKNTFAESSVNLSVRYDNIENVALLMGLRTKLPAERCDLFLDLRGRLGERSSIASNLCWKFRPEVNLNGGYKFSHNTANVYKGSSKVANVTYYRHKGYLEYMHSWHRVLWQAGVEYNYFSWDGLFAEDLLEVKSSHYYAYYLKAHYNTLDDQWYPRSGRRLEGSYHLVTSNLYNYHGQQATHIFDLHYFEAASINRRVTFIPQAGVRVLKHPYDAFYPLRNFFGGLDNGSMIDGARAFCGVTQLQIVDDALLATGLDIRGRISKNQFIIGSGSIAEIASTPEFWMENDPEWGVRLGYMYKTLIGPVSASIHYSSLTEHVNGLLNIGFTF